MARYYDLSEFIDSKLPSGMFSYVPKPKTVLEIIVTDWTNSTSYFTITINLDLTLPQQKTQALVQIENFRKIWDSPLMLALREY